MIKKITVCVCDICGSVAEAKPCGSQYNETDYTRPAGWNRGATQWVDICPQCVVKINAQKDVWRKRNE